MNFVSIRLMFGVTALTTCAWLFGCGGGSAATQTGTTAEGWRADPTVLLEDQSPCGVRAHVFVDAARSTGLYRDVIGLARGSQGLGTGFGGLVDKLRAIHMCASPAVREGSSGAIWEFNVVDRAAAEAVLLSLASSEVQPSADEIAQRATHVTMGDRSMSVALLDDRMAAVLDPSEVLRAQAIRARMPTTTANVPESGFAPTGIRAAEVYVDQTHIALPEAEGFSLGEFSVIERLVLAVDLRADTVFLQARVTHRGTETGARFADALRAMKSTFQSHPVVMLMGLGDSLRRIEITSEGARTGCGELTAEGQCRAAGCSWSAEIAEVEPPLPQCSATSSVTVKAAVPNTLVMTLLRLGLARFSAQ